MKKEFKKLLKEAFEAGRDYQYQSERPNLDLKESYPNFTKWYNSTKEKQCDIHVVMHKKFKKAIKLYKKIKADLDLYVSMRGSSFGISIGKDEYAIKWRSKQMRLEIVEAFLEGKKPNWHFADYLDYEEKQRRNQ